MYPLKRKSDVLAVFTKFKRLVENQFWQKKLNSLYGQWRRVHYTLLLVNFLSTNGISHMISPPHTPEHNGLPNANINIYSKRAWLYYLMLQCRESTSHLLWRRQCISSIACRRNHCISKVIFKLYMVEPLTMRNKGSLDAYAFRGSDHMHHIN